MRSFFLILNPFLLGLVTACQVVDNPIPVARYIHQDSTARHPTVPILDGAIPGVPTPPRELAGQYFYDEIWPPYLHVEQSQIQTFCTYERAFEGVEYWFMLSAGYYKIVYDPHSRNHGIQASSDQPRKTVYFSNDLSRSFPIATLDTRRIRSPGGLVTPVLTFTNIYGDLVKLGATSSARSWLPASLANLGQQTGQGFSAFHPTVQAQALPFGISSSTPQIQVHVRWKIYLVDSSRAPVQTSTQSVTDSGSTTLQFDASGKAKLIANPSLDLYRIGTQKSNGVITQRTMEGFYWTTPMISSAWRSSDPLNLGTTDQPTTIDKDFLERVRLGATPTSLTPITTYYQEHYCP